jgi:hypothetical protein
LHGARALPQKRGGLKVLSLSVNPTLSRQREKEKGRKNLQPLQSEAEIEIAITALDL